jgi:molybdopterin-guanine dinucleotide biosynthesis protein A
MCPVPGIDGIPAGLLLTGGASRRLGRDKATVVVGGERLVDRAARLLAGVARPVIEVGPGRSRLPWVLEDDPGSGPLAAVAAGASLLQRGGHRGPALVLAVDLPLVTEGLLALLAGHPSTGCVVPVDGAGYPQPLCARYSAAALSAASGLSAAGFTSPRALLERTAVTWLPPPAWSAAAGSAHPFADVDTDEDLASIRAVLEDGAGSMIDE